ncbi:MAG: glycine cleavage system protein H [Halothiobacillus sp.]
MTVRSDRRYGQTHEWTMQDGNDWILGVTEQGQELLGDVVFAQLPAVGATVRRGEACATLESVKAASDVLCPVDGVVTAINMALVDSPELINDDPLDSGWILRISPTGTPDAWMSPEEYQAALDAGA